MSFERITNEEAQAVLNEYLKTADKKQERGLMYALITLDNFDRYDKLTADTENEKFCDGYCRGCQFYQPLEGKCATKCSIKRFIFKEGEFEEVNADEDSD